MTTPSNPINLFTPFLPSTYDVPNEEDRLHSFLEDKFSQFADVINDKTIGAFTQSVENLNGNKFAYDTTSKVRSGYQYLVRIANYPSSGTLTLSPPPNINPQFVIFQAWGSASKPPSALNAGDGDFFSFFGSGNPKITFTFSDTSIVVTTTALGTGYSGFICITYIRDGI